MKKFISFVVFVAIGLLLSQVPFTYLVGANARFTLFDFFGPITGNFLGSLTGALGVLLVQVTNWAIHGFSLQPAAIIRFFPVVAATLYFARPSKWYLAIPGVAIVAFLIHPEGRQAAAFTLYWLIPFIAHRLSNRFIFAKALAATFIAHSVGGALWIWTLNMKATLWMSLLPVVWKERGLMALGITLSFLAVEKLLQISIVKGWIPRALFRLRSPADAQ